VTGVGDARGAATILVADDDPRMRLELGETLRLAAYRVLVAADGAEALSLVGTHRPDVVVVDLRMSVVDGLEVCRQLKSDPATRGVAVVILNAKARDDDLARGLAAGADAYVTKPFSPRALLALLADRLRERSDAPSS
jgi:two-component system alkaline phosphatase synthesis response regulator PhoP